jgi:gliding motility-associated-like protein
MSTRLCANQPLQGTTTAATLNTTSDFDFCTVNSATVWYHFTTNSVGGDATVSFTNMNFNTGAGFGQTIDVIFFSATTPCNQASMSPASNCANSGVDFSVSNPLALPLAANTTYYILVNGNTGGTANSAECDFTIEISGPSVDASFPTASISALDTILCQGDDESIETIISNCTDTISFDWYYNNALVNSSSTIDFNTTGLTEDGYLKLIVNCGSLCVYSDTTDSIFYEVTAIEVNAGPDKFIQEGGLAILDGTGVGTPLWTPANTLTNPSSLTPSATPSVTTTYFLTMTNGACEKTDSVNVFVGEVITIYSGFSPNNDNINDKWVIKNSAQYPNMEVIVYDRAGQKVFQTIGYTTQDKWWDGTYKGKPLPVSTYFYVINLNDPNIGDEGIFKGPVNIIK